MSDLPHFHDTGRELRVKLSGPASAKLATYRRQDHPGLTDEEVAAYLIEDSLIGLGLLDLPPNNRGKEAGRK